MMMMMMMWLFSMASPSRASGDRFLHGTLTTGCTISLWATTFVCDVYAGATIFTAGTFLHFFTTSWR
uniref:Putative secreted protein n=1 Tax=Anopheles darlingi TaxID=43151 RepID=A0A2M4DRH1_ANODA